MSSAQLLPNVLQTWFTSNGTPLSGGQIFSYIAGTSTPQATYTDETAGTPNTNPVVLNSAGQASIWLRTDLSYKIVIEDSLNNVIATIDQINIVNPASIDKTKIAANIANQALYQNGDGSIGVGVDNVYISVNGSNELTLIPGAITADFLPSTSKLEVVYKNTRDYSDQGSIKQVPQYEWTTPTLLSGPTAAGTCNACKWSPNGEFLAIGISSSPYVVIYQVSALGNLGIMPLTKLANPGTLPLGAVNDLAWSPCGDFLACANTNTGTDSPSITIYQRSGNTFTKLSDPAVLPTTLANVVGGYRIAWSPNSDFLAMSYTNYGISGPIHLYNLIIYERSGTTFTCITSDGNGDSTITANAQGTHIGWSPDSYLFGAIDSSTTEMDLWSRADNVFTSITPPVLSSYAGNISSFAFSPDGNFLSVGLVVTPFVLNFQRSGTLGAAFTQLANPGTLPPGSVSMVTWSLNSEYLFCGDDSDTSPYMTVYKVTNPTTTPVFTVQTAPGTPPAGVVNAADWSQTKQYLAVGTSTTPYIQVYQSSSSLNGDSLLWSRGVPNV
jgi:hypothetical protein